jgi:hypothetical protein
MATSLALSAQTVPVDNLMTNSCRLVAQKKMMPDVTQLSRFALHMNRKRRKLLEGVSRGLDISEAGRVAGYGTAQSAHRAMNLIRTRMPDALDKVGFPAEKLLKNLEKSLEATKTLYCTYRGKVTDTLEVPDHKIQLRAIIELLKLHGAYPMTNRRKSYDHSDACSAPIVRVVIPDLEPSGTDPQGPADAAADLEP